MTKYPASFERGQLGLRPQLALDLLESRDGVGRRRGDPDEIQPADAARRAGEARGRRCRARNRRRAEARAGADALEAWDDRVAADRGAVLFVRFWDRYRRRTARRSPPPGMRRIRPGRRRVSPLQEAVKHLAAAVTAVRAAFGSERVVGVRRTVSVSATSICRSDGATAPTARSASCGSTRSIGAVPSASRATSGATVRPSASATPGFCWSTSRRPSPDGPSSRMARRQIWIRH